MGNELGAAIKAARTANGMRQQDLADTLGVKQGTVSAWEIGQNVPDGPTLLTLGRLLGVSFGQSGLSADAAYALGQASGELRAIGEMAAEMSRQAFAAADRVAVPTPLVYEDVGTRARGNLRVAEVAATPRAPRKARGR